MNQHVPRQIQTDSETHDFGFFLLSVLGFELRAWCLLGRHSAAWVTLPALFCFSYFLGRVSPFCQGPASDCSSSTYDLAHSWDDRHASPCLVDWLRWGLPNILPKLDSNLDPPKYLGLQAWVIVPSLSLFEPGTHHCSKQAWRGWLG
jgi:hypothetical protein